MTKLVTGGSFIAGPGAAGWERALEACRECEQNGFELAFAGLPALEVSGGSGSDRFVTLSVARLDSKDSKLRLASAGHPEPLVWRDQLQSWVGRELGGLPGPEAEIPLLPGDVVLFYSDGVTAAAGPSGGPFGLARVRQLVASGAELPAAALVESIAAAVEKFQGEVPSSGEVTLVAVKALPRVVEFALPATAQSARELAILAQRVSHPYGSQVSLAIEIAAAEISANVVVHSGPLGRAGLHGRFKLFADRVELEVLDDGAPFNPLAVPEPAPNELREGGYGLAMIRRAVDEFDYQPATAEGNRWRVVKRLPRVG